MKWIIYFNSLPGLIEKVEVEGSHIEDATRQFVCAHYGKEPILCCIKKDAVGAIFALLN
jgi:hypothetical protein